MIPTKLREIPRLNDAGAALTFSQPVTRQVKAHRFAPSKGMGSMNNLRNPQRVQNTTQQTIKTRMYRLDREDERVVPILVGAPSMSTIFAHYFGENWRRTSSG